MKRIETATRDVHRRVAASYILAFGVIAVCLVTMFLTSHWTLQEQQTSVALVDCAGRQRALSQRMALASQQLVFHEDPVSAAKARGMLSDARKLFAENSNLLGDGEWSRMPEASTDDRIHHLGLSQNSNDFINQVDQLLVLVPGDPRRIELAQSIFELASGPLVDQLDTLSAQAERHSTRRIRYTRQIESLLFVITLIVLVCEAVFIFQPILNANEKIDWAANHDPLTALPNRRYLAQCANAALQESRRNQLSIGFMHVDLDCFKSVNDTLGHGAGDAVLKSVAETLRKNLRPEQMIARIGGDEFAVLFTNVRHVDELVGPAQRLIKKLAEPVPYQDKNCNIGCSIGLAISNPDEMDFERVLMDADIALYEAKNNGRNQYQIITRQLRGRFEHREQVTKDIRLGIERDEFEPFFQPQFDSLSGQITGVEALARWIKRDSVFEKNAEFVQIADEIGLLTEIDEQILHKALAAFVVWRDQGFAIPRLSLNFSMRELEETEFVSRLAATVIKYGLRASDISIEILESVFFDSNNQIVVTNINALSRAGFTVELDDFGTGHAAVTSLLDLAIDRVKLDQSLIRDVGSGGAGLTITRTLITLASELNIQTLAEGVETEQQVQVLQDLGCTHHQGYYYARPMSETAFGEWLESHTSTPYPRRPCPAS